MTFLRHRFTSLRLLGSDAARAAATSVASHWALALFSLVAAFGIWVAVQDIENPLVEGTAPAEGGIPVEAVNIPDDYLVTEIKPLTVVQVESRKDVLPDPQASDFRAIVDVQRLEKDGQAQTLPVRIVALRDHVRILQQDTLSVSVALVKRETRRLAVTPRPQGAPQNGYTADDPAAVSVQPSTVEVSGPEALVNDVVSVDLDVPLAGATGTVEHEGELVARTAKGNTVNVTITPRRARAVWPVEQVFFSRQVVLFASVAGQPAEGYRVSDISIDAPSVLVSGPKQWVEGLNLPLVLEKIDITGAKSDVVAVKAVPAPPNLTVNRETVTVTVKIVAISCGGGEAAPCGSTGFWVPLTVEQPPPAGLTLEHGQYDVMVRVSGPLAALQKLQPNSIVASVSLQNATLGTGLYAVRVTLPSGPDFAGLHAETVAPYMLTLITTPP